MISSGMSLLRENRLRYRSLYCVDFTRSFSLYGTLENTISADGFSITFQTDPNYKYLKDKSSSGSGLCVYGVEAGAASGYYAANALVNEVDTYDSTNYCDLDGDQLRQILIKKGENGDVVVPHLAINTTTSEGKEVVHDASLITTGDKDDENLKKRSVLNGKKGTYKVKIDWNELDYDWQGTYTLSYVGY